MVVRIFLMKHEQESLHIILTTDNRSHKSAHYGVITRKILGTHTLMEYSIKN